MKKLIVISIIFSAILLAGCENDMLEIVDAKESAFVASIEKFENDTQTKTSLSAQNSVVWNAGDQIAIFQGAPVVSKFEVEQACEGTSDGVFNPVQESASQGSGFTSVMEIAANLAVYPYAQELTLSESANDAQEHTYIISNVTIPAQQEYLENSFPKGTFAMVAVTESVSDKMLKFRNVLGAIKLQLLGDCKVKTIEIEGNKGEMLSGRANITAYKDSYVPVITMLDEEATKVTLNCGEGVQLNPDNATNFIIALPPTNFEEGFTVTVTDAAGNGKEIKTTVSNTVQRSYILKMPKLNINHLNAGEELDYILFEDEIVEELCIHAFDTNNDGKLQFAEAAAVTDIRVMSLKNWYIKFFNELRYFTSLEIIPDEYFKGQSQMISIKLPSRIKTIGASAFENCSSLRQLSIPEGVEIVSAYTFSGCTSIKDVKLPSSLYAIETYAFANCNALTNIKLPEGMENIGSYAFLNCSSITEMNVELGDDNNFSYSLSSGIFKGCTSLVSVTLPSNIWAIGFEAFYGCKSLVNCEIPESVYGFGAYAFFGCESLENINLTADDIYYFQEYVFSGCKSLKTVTFAEPEFYQGTPLRQFDIGDGAFSNCTSLISVDFNANHIKSFGKEIFKNCESLQNVTIPATISHIPENAFEGCKRLKKVDGGGVVEAIAEKAFSGCSWLEAVEFLPKVKTIGMFAFENCAMLNNIALNREITTVLQGTFSGCSSLSLDLPETIVEVEDYAFSGCKSITLTNNNIEIDSDAFSGCMDVNVVYETAHFPSTSWETWADKCMTLNVTIPEGTRAIPDQAFKGRNRIKHMDIPASVEIIGSSAFQYCSSLVEFEMPESVRSIGDNVFEGCRSLRNIKLSSTLESIGNSVFYDCSSLEKIEIPKSVNSIGNYVFFGCEALKDIKLPSNLKVISKGMFTGCEQLEYIQLPSCVESIGNHAFYGCSSLVEFEMPETVISVGDYILRSCVSLKTVKLSSNLQAISEGMFSNCEKLENIQIPQKVESIANVAFGDCTSLQSCIIESTSLASYGSYVFRGCDVLTSIYVPSTSVDAYKTGWPEYADLIKAIQ